MENEETGERVFVNTSDVTKNSVIRVHLPVRDGLQKLHILVKEIPAGVAATPRFRRALFRGEV